MSTENLNPGTVFGRDFRVLERLAAGGMGTVYVAIQLSTGKRRALKVMHAQYEGDERARQRFIQEARVGGSIDSDHIVEMVGAGIDGDTNTPWIAMELLNGQDLKAVVNERGALPREDVLEICRQLCHALAAAHRMGLVHRDLKPENIFLANPRREGVPFTVKLLDFGIAKLVQESQTQTSHTQAVGSPRWMAPEQAERGGRIVPATDVWALGLIVFNLLTGRCYWRTANSANPSVMQQMCEVIMDPIEPASARAAEYGQGGAIPPGFDEWFARCVNRDVSARFTDAGEAMTALGRALAPAAAQRRSTRPRADFRLDQPLPRDAPFSMGDAPAATPSNPPSNESMRTPAVTHAPPPRDVARSMTPPSPTADLSASQPIPPSSPAPSRKGPLVVLAASVATLAVVAGIAFTRARPAPQPLHAPPAALDAGAPALAVPDAGPLTIDSGAALAADDVADMVIAEDAVLPPASPASNVAAPLAPRLRGPRGAADAGAAPSATSVRDDIAYQESVRGILRGRHVEFVACYERGTENNAGVSGNLDISFQVGSDGRATNVATRGLGDAPEVGRCIADSIRGVNFPAPPSGTSAIVHSLHFSRRFESPPEPAAPAPEAP